MKRNGFTLVELIVSIAIIGILTGVVTTQVANARKKAIDSNLQTALAQIATQASDIDNIDDGATGEGLDAETCLNIFTNENIRRLITYTTEVTGRPVISAFCSKGLEDVDAYKFTFMTESAVDEDKYLCVDQDGAVRSIDKSNFQEVISSFSCDAVAVSGEGDAGDGGGEEGGDGGGDETPEISVSVEYSHYSNELVATFNQPILYSGDLFNPYALGLRIVDANGADKTGLFMDQSNNTIDGVTTDFHFSPSSLWGGTYTNPCYIGDPDHTYDPETGERDGPYQAIFSDVYGVSSHYAVSSVSATINFNCTAAE